MADPERIPRRPLYLARQSYRRRRMMDAARFLPLLGAVLLLLPLLWMPEGRGLGTAGTMLYLFLIWFFLILAAAALAPVLTRGEEAQPSPRATEDEGPG